MRNNIVLRIMVREQELGLVKLAQTLTSEGPFRCQLAQRRVRGLFNGKYAFDTLDAYLVWERPYRPCFFVPTASFTSDAMLTRTSPIDDTRDCAHLARLTVGDKSTDRVLIFSTQELDNLVMVDFGELDQWFEESEPIYGQPKDPYKRIDVLRTTRRIQVTLGGVTLAESCSPLLLLETSLRPRYYLLPADVKWEYLSKSDTETYCPYKGRATYYNINVGGEVYKELAWCYPFPVHESAPIAGCVCFYDEKAEFRIDGVRIQRV